MKLGPIDRILVAMDPARRRSDFAVVLHLRSTPPVEALRAGARSARLRYPLTGCVLDSGGLQWRPAPGPIEEMPVFPLSSESAKDVEAFLDRPFDLSQEPPIRQALLKDEATDRALLVTCAHHAALDGMSAGLWLRSQFGVACGIDAPLSSPAPFEPVRLRRHPAPVRESLYSPGGSSQALWTSGSKPSPDRRWMTIELPGEAPADALATALLDASVEWNRSHGAASDGLSLWMPVNIRRRGDRGVGNGTSRIRVYAGHGVRAQIRASLRSGEWAVPADPWALRLPRPLGDPLIRAFVNRPSVDMGSVVFSAIENLNAADSAVFAGVEKIELVGQLHERHPLAVNAIGFGGKTFVTFTCDPARLGPADVAWFGAAVTAAIATPKCSARTADPPPPAARLRPRFNDALRGAIGLSSLILGAVCAGVQRIRIARFRRAQASLRLRFGIGPDTPVRVYGPEVEAEIHRVAAPRGGRLRWAETSGSTGAPKRIPYTPRRLRSARWAFVDHFVRLFLAHRVWRTSLYVFRPIEAHAEEDDRSLTSLLVEERQLPSYLGTLQAPYRVEGHPAIQTLTKRYGAAAVRLWVLTLSNPGVVYATNPSTFWLFLHDLATKWEEIRRLVGDFHANPESFEPAVRRIAERLDSSGSAERFGRIAASRDGLPLSVCAPAIGTIVSWTGGYVRPFLDRLAAALPAGRYRIVPMYSMSTETIATAACFRRGDALFLPIAPRVLYEFIEEGQPDRPENVRTPDRLEADKTYTLVVSDAFGLRRYQTEDVFLCRRLVAGLPDLHFLRRRNLEFSFTGEKLSAVQVANALAQVRAGLAAEVSADMFLTCVPSHPATEAVPHYRIVVAGRSPDIAPPAVLDAAARLFDGLLREANSEYRAKRDSGRLAAPRGACLTLADFIAGFGGNVSAADGQFKFLPLYARTWEEAFPLRRSAA